MDRKIACINKISDRGLALLRDNYEITAEPQEAHGWLVRSAKLHDSVFPKSLRVIGRAGAGVNNIPLDRCAEEGIVVFNTPGANANGVTELVVAGMILASRDVIGGTNWIREQGEIQDIAAAAEKAKAAFVGTEIRGKTLGIIGLGAIGHLVANAAVGLGMEVLGFDPSIPVQYAWRLSRSVKHIEKLEEMLPRCDYLTIHVPLNDKTRKMIGVKELALIKKGAILLNFSRDALCDEDAVLNALKDGKLRRYVVDFPNSKNVTFPNTIVTPHLGASTDESEENCAVMAVEEIQNYLDYGNIVNSVNYPDVSLGMLNSPTRVVVMHRNIPNAINRMASLFGDAGYNIEQMVSNSRGKYAAAIIDVSEPLARDFVLQLREHEEVLKVRVIKGQTQPTPENVPEEE